MFKMKKNQKGFTLVEVLLVVVILGILAAVALPRFLTTRVESQKRTCQTNLSALNSAIEEYVFINGEDPGVIDDVVTADRFPDGVPVCPSNTDPENDPSYELNGDVRAACLIDAAEHVLPSGTT
jgi:prepilin-type N-terminal cleavage/methylation domain-containing protein